MLYDIQKRMKDFYKDIKSELADINTGDKEEEEEVDNLMDDETYHIVDIERLNDEIDSFMNKGEGKKKK